MKPALGLLIIVFIFSFFLYIGWEKWRVSTPQLLPQQSLISKSSSLIQGIYYETSVLPEKSDWYSSADYRLWIPSEVKVIHGLIVMQHGCGEPAASTGLNHANDLQWQALAVKHKFAILASKISVGEHPCEFWAFPNAGSETAFLKSLQALGQKSNHPELETVPWVLRGHSGGSDWASFMLQKYPTQIIAAVLMRGGGYPLIGNNSHKILDIPVLFVSGKNDPYDYDCITVPRQVFLHYRQRGALWAFALAPNTAHEAGGTRTLAIPYIDAIIAARINLDQGLPLTTKVKATEAWLGNISNQAVYPEQDYKEDISNTVWLPNEEIARKWQEYVAKGEILPVQRPKIPIEIHALQKDHQGILITWDYLLDLEIGLPSFRIYRNGFLIATLKGQEHNFGDAPEPESLELQFRDKGGDSDSSYSVAAFNTLGESMSSKTKVITVN